MGLPGAAGVRPRAAQQPAGGAAHHPQHQQRGAAGGPGPHLQCSVYPLVFLMCFFFKQVALLCGIYVKFTYQVLTHFRRQSEFSVLILS